MGTHTKVTYSSFGDGVHAAIPTLLGYITISATFGVIASSAGFSTWQIFLYSAVLYAGSAQFIVVSMLLSGASISSIVLMVFLVNFRMFLQSLSATQLFSKQPFISGIAMGSLMTDESFGVMTLAQVSGKRPSISWMHGLNVASWLAWWISGILSSKLGAIITDPEKWGLDFALTAMFAGLWVLTTESMWKQKNQAHSLTAGTVLLTVGLLWILLCFTSAAVATLVSSVVASAIITFLSKKKGVRA
ncbi:branched-chain amino acid transport protein AzlC [Liquorilactobacillus sucicola DSM 21376 = JCM 15457]|uniref:Branched-chain amino acid permease (Azaleucine resistance) n=1 Tax=Liquorilactobacillus sucicola DSM 21376 = JCM 15457 TaxID=1423806 RepID=A0A023CUQ9_9LACO|nr:AzlC family ABC transporter permease [Liquorilactobacillus sucicola]KRN05557.1 branched-chain amino acid permease (azaleucine resistance) [Liquorilactobacillus sucicola DSM 21376 = JCM 15457]GAJ25638.1 branched-chain amino acid transport protein AzlC [Liquorilactobacillus sucicola DSM 21376 = JCM 15457]